MSDCRTCKFNSYGSNPKIKDWVSCNHSVTLAKMPKWQLGDPEWVNMMTGDIPVSRIDELQNCPTYDGRTPGEEA